MKPDVAETEFPVAAQELRLPVGAESEWRVAAADRVLPIMIEDFRLLQKTAFEGGHVLVNPAACECASALP